MSGMRMAVGLLLLVVCLAIVPGLSLGETRSGTETIHEDYYMSITINFFDGESMDVTYTATVTDGPNIDVFFLDAAGLADYEDSETFEYYTAMSDLNTASTTKSTTLAVKGAYYLVLDNTEAETAPPWNALDDVAIVIWTLITETDKGTDGDISSEWNEWLLGGVACIVLGIVMFIVWIVLGIWVYKDAEKRGANGVMWLIVVILLGIIGLIIYLVVRPKMPAAPPPGYAPPPPGYAPPPPMAPPPQ